MTDTHSFEDIRYETNGSVGEVIIDRPEKRNALRPQTLDEIDAARAATSSIFSAGADLAFMTENIDDQATCEAYFEDLNGLFDSFEESSLGVVACVTGKALAGGLELVLACDVAVAASDAELGDQHINVNLMAAGGGSQRLPRLVGPRRAKELVLTGKTISATTAREWGLVNEVVEAGGDEDATREAAVALAGEIAQHHPRVRKRSKDLIQTGMDVGLEAGLEYERMTALAHVQTEEVQEALERFS